MRLVKGNFMPGTSMDRPNHHKMIIPVDWSRWTAYGTFGKSVKFSNLLAENVSDFKFRGRPPKTKKQVSGYNPD